MNGVRSATSAIDYTATARQAEGPSAGRMTVKVRKGEGWNSIVYRAWNEAEIFLVENCGYERVDKCIPQTVEMMVEYNLQHNEALFHNKPVLRERWEQALKNKTYPMLHPGQVLLVPMGLLHRTDEDCDKKPADLPPPGKDEREGKETPPIGGQQKPDCPCEPQNAASYQCIYERGQILRDDRITTGLTRETSEKARSHAAADWRSDDVHGTAYEGCCEFIEASNDPNGLSIRDVLRNKLENEGPEATYEYLVESLRYTHLKGEIELRDMVNALFRFMELQYDEGNEGHKIASTQTASLQALLSQDCCPITADAWSGSVGDFLMHLLQDAGIETALLRGNTEHPEFGKGGQYTLLYRLQDGEYIWNNGGDSIMVKAGNIVQAAKRVNQVSPDFSIDGIITLQGTGRGSTYKKYALEDESVFGDDIDPRSAKNMTRTFDFLSLFGLLKRSAQEMPDQPNKLHVSAASVRGTSASDHGTGSSSDVLHDRDSAGASIHLAANDEQTLQRGSISADVEHNRAVGSLSWTRISPKDHRLWSHTFRIGSQETGPTDLFNHSNDSAVQYQVEHINGNWYADAAFHFSNLNGSSATTMCPYTYRDSDISTTMVRAGVKYLLPSFSIDCAVPLQPWLGTGVHWYRTESDSSWDPSIALGPDWDSDFSAHGSNSDLSGSFEAGLASGYSLGRFDFTAAGALGITGTRVYTNAAEEGTLFRQGHKADFRTGLSYGITDSISIFGGLGSSCLKTPGIMEKTVRDMTTGITFRDIAGKSGFDGTLQYNRRSVHEKLDIGSFKETVSDETASSLGAYIAYPLTPSVDLGVEAVYRKLNDPAYLDRNAEDVRAGMELGISF